MGVYSIIGMTLITLGLTSSVRADYPTSPPYSEKTTIVEETTTYPPPSPDGVTVIEETTTYPGLHSDETTVVEKTTTYPDPVILDPVPEPPYETIVEEEVVTVLPD
jgi:hypothetical protein